VSATRGQIRGRVGRRRAERGDSGNAGLGTELAVDEIYDRSPLTREL